MVTINKTPLTAGLYLVATPIGAARDITLRALDILSTADILAAEDTRTLRRLLQIHGVKVGDRPLIAYNDHNGGAVRPRLLGFIAAGRSVAYASDAGTPLISDPGFQLAREARDTGLLVTAAPGPSAVIAALSLSGLPTDRFLFAGFPPAAKGARAKWLEELRNVPATLVLFESPRRIERLLGELGETFGSERQAAICRELTKKFEEISRGSVTELSERVTEVPPKGEIVVVIDRASKVAKAEDLNEALMTALKTMTVREAAEVVSAALGFPKRQVYQAALGIGKSDRP